MDGDDRKRFLDELRKVSIEKLFDHKTRVNGPNGIHFNCRSSIEPLPPKMVERVYLDGKRELVSAGGQPERNTVVSWDGLTDMLGADTVKRIREVS